MAVLKSPKNVATKNLWMKRVTQRTKKTTFHFYANEWNFERSTLKNFSSKRDHALFFKKYRFVLEDYKEEKKIYGRILPSTLTKQLRRRVKTTHLASSWETNKKFRNDFLALIGSNNLIQ